MSTIIVLDHIEKIKEFIANENIDTLKFENLVQQFISNRINLGLSDVKNELNKQNKNLDKKREEEEKKDSSNMNAKGEKGISKNKNQHKNSKK